MGQIKDIINLKHADVERLYKRILQEPFNQRCPKFKFLQKYQETETELKKFEQGLSTGKLHTAVFDSILSGKTYAIIANMLIQAEKGRPENSLDLRHSVFLPQFYGKVFVYGISGMHWQSLVDDFINQENQRCIEKDNIFHITIPKQWGENDLYETFRGHVGQFDIKWLNDRTCFIALKDKMRKIDMVNRFIASKRIDEHIFQVQTYNTYERQRSLVRGGGCPTAADLGMLSGSSSAHSSPYTNGHNTEVWSISWIYHFFSRT